MPSRFRTTLRVFVVLIALLVIGLSYLTWRLSVEPLQSTRLTPYVESAFDHYLPGTHAQIRQTLAGWNNLDHVVSLRAAGVQIFDADGNVIADVPNLNVEISVWGLLVGRMFPLALNVDAPHFKLVRNNDGVLLFGDFTAESKAGASKPDNVKASLASALHDLTHSFLREIVVKDVTLDVHDDKTKSDWSVHVPEIAVRRALTGLAGKALVAVTQKDQTSTLEIQYDYDAAKGLHNLQTNLSALTPSFFAGGHPGTLGLGALSVLDLPLSGDVSMAVDDQLNVKTVAADVHGDQGNLVYPDFWDQPRPVKSVQINAAYNSDAPDANLAVLAMDFDGPQLKMTVKGRQSTVPEHDVLFELAAQLDNWPMDQFAQLWPKPVIANPRQWIAKSLSKGVFTHGEAEFKGAFSWNDLANAEISEGAGTVTANNGRVDYLDGMPPVDGVNAKATFNLDQMTVDLSGGGVWGLKLVPFSILLTDFEKDVQNIYIPLKFTGPVTDVLKLINVSRLGYAKAIGLSPDDVTGTASGVVEMRFPLLNALEMKDVDIKANVDLTNVASSKLVNKIDVTQGNVNLSLDQHGFDAKGAADLNAVPAQIVYRENFDEQAGQPLRKATVTAILNDDQWKKFDIDALRGTRGPVAATIQMTQPKKGLTLINGAFDMTGAEIHVDQLNWKKPQGVAAQLDVSVEMPEKQEIEIKSIDLSGPQATVKGQATLSADGGQLTSLTLDPLIVGRTNASLNYEEMDDDEKTLRFEANGKSLDVSGLKGGHDVAASDPRPKEYHISVDRLYTSETGAIDQAQGFAVRDPQGWNQIGLKGVADGAPLNIDLDAKDGTRFFAASCDDFGKALKGLGMTDTVSGGKIQINGQGEADNPRVIDGTVKIGSFAVKGLPALVVLLNATSPFGFKNLITGNMDFDRLKGKFRWQGDAIDLKDVSVSGNAVGLEVEGKVDMNAATADLHGIVAPFSMVNNFLNSIPLVGDVLTGGGNGGVLAVAYTIKGDLNDPKVSVNPASLLTPGFLRNLFFNSDNKDNSSVDAPAASAAPAQNATPPAPSNISPK